MGHNAPVTNASFSHDRSMVVTSSMDKSARVWEPGRKSDALLVLDTQGGNVPSRSQPNQWLETFKDEVRDAQFYYRDKFLVLSCSSSVYLYKYAIESEPEDDAKRWSRMWAGFSQLY